MKAFATIWMNRYADDHLLFIVPPFSFCTYSDTPLPAWGNFIFWLIRSSVVLPSLCSAPRPHAGASPPAGLARSLLLKSSPAIPPTVVFTSVSLRVTSIRRQVHIHRFFSASLARWSFVELGATVCVCVCVCERGRVGLCFCAFVCARLYEARLATVCVRETFSFYLSSFCPQFSLPSSFLSFVFFVFFCFCLSSPQARCILFSGLRLLYVCVCASEKPEEVGMVWIVGYCRGRMSYFLQ